MVFSKFHTKVPGKWILSGEHTVIRGGTAIALPHPELYLELNFSPSKQQGLLIKPCSHAPLMKFLIKEILSILDVKEYPNGTLNIYSNIPKGAGLGSSAALCAG